MALSLTVNISRSEFSVFTADLFDLYITRDFFGIRFPFFGEFCSWGVNKPFGFWSYKPWRTTRIISNEPSVE